MLQKIVFSFISHELVEIISLIVCVGKVIFITARKTLSLNIKLFVSMTTRCSRKTRDNIGGNSKVFCGQIRPNIELFNYRCKWIQITRYYDVHLLMSMHNDRVHIKWADETLSRNEFYLHEPRTNIPDSRLLRSLW